MKSCSAIADPLEDYRPKSILVYGPSGCGKSIAVQVAAHTSKLKLVRLSGAAVAEKRDVVGEAEALVRSAFTQVDRYQDGCILFLDQLEALCPKRDPVGGYAASAQNARIVAQVLTFLDGIKKRQRKLIIIGATNLPNQVDPAVRRSGRFDREVEVPMPSVETRALIFESILFRRHVSIPSEEALLKLAQKAVGYVGADIEHLVNQAILLQQNQKGSSIEYCLESSLNHVVPMARKGHVVEFSKMSWDDIGGLEEIKIKLRILVERSKSFSRLGIALPKGILLHGPPGCSKTSLVRALASSLSDSAAFFSTDGASIYSSYFGEAEANIRRLFDRARANAPCVLFIDEIDSIVSSRTADNVSQVQNRVLSTLLNEMDGIQSITSHHPVMVVAATNFPEKLDSALLRPGRFDHIFYVFIVLFFSFFRMKLLSFQPFFSRYLLQIWIPEKKY